MSATFKVYYFVGFFTFSFHLLSGQDQKVADSLILAYQSGNYQANELELLKSIASNETDPERKLEFAHQLINKAVPDSLFDFLISGYLQRGNALLQKGDLVQALESYFQSIKYARRGDTTKIGKLTISVADTYSQIGNSRNAEIYYNKGILLLRKTNDSVSLATALSNAGDEYFKSKKYDSAILFFSEAGPIFKKVNYLIGTAYNLGNLGMVYAEQNQDVAAAANINEAIAILETFQDYYPISVYLTYMADIYLRKNDIATARRYLERSLTLATRYHLKEQISEANLNLSELYDRIGDTGKSYKHYRAYIAYRDSVMNLKSVEKMANLRTDYEVAQKQIEVDLLNQQKQNQRIVVVASIISAVLILLLALGLYRRYHFIKITNKVIEAEKNRSDKLLLNILPDETAQELKQYGKVKTKRFESVTVVFTDFKDFTRVSEQVDPELLIRSIDYYFREFDLITSKYGLEKIKTIGDSYMCAGGLPVPDPLHAVHVVQAAREMIELVNKKLMANDDLLHFQVRIGIHTGPVVAGIVGMKKWQYDIWGDTVNIASRLESASEVGRINLSESTYQQIKELFPCSYRGELEAKNRGPMKMYYLV